MENPDWTELGKLANERFPVVLKTLHVSESKDEITVLKAALIQQRAYIQHWMDDVRGNLKPLIESLENAERLINEALEDRP